MARADLLIRLVQSGIRGDKASFRKVVEAIIAEERANQHHLVADRLSELITTAGSTDLLARDASAARVADLLLEVVPRRRLASLHLAPPVASAVEPRRETAPPWAGAGAPP